LPHKGNSKIIKREGLPLEDHVKGKSRRRIGKGESGSWNREQRGDFTEIGIDWEQHPSIEMSGGGGCPPRRKEELSHQ